MRQLRFLCSFTNIGGWISVCLKDAQKYRHYLKSTGKMFSRPTEPLKKCHVTLNTPFFYFVERVAGDSISSFPVPLSYESSHEGERVDHWRTMLSLNLIL